MASIHNEILIDADLESVWAAVREVGAVHLHLFPDLVTDCTLQDGARTVTFANGMVLKELIVSVDGERHRIAYASVGGRATHHNASIQVFEDGPGRARVAWITDFLPDDLAGIIGPLVEQGSALMKRTLESPRA